MVKSSQGRWLGAIVWKRDDNAGCHVTTNRCVLAVTKSELVYISTILQFCCGALRSVESWELRVGARGWVVAGAFVNNSF